MTQEYLFINEKYKKEIESFTVSDKVQKKIKIIENSSCWTLSLNIDGENEEIAKLLDSLNIQICQNYKPTVLSNGCSAYFNKSLYPIVNEFERKLRKLLYLASALQGDNDSYKVINDIESKDLGEIFEALFSDSDFVKKVKEQINKKYVHLKILQGKAYYIQRLLLCFLHGNRIFPIYVLHLLLQHRVQ